MFDLTLRSATSYLSNAQSLSPSNEVPATSKAAPKSPPLNSRSGNNWNGQNHQPSAVEAKDTETPPVSACPSKDNIYQSTPTNMSCQLKTVPSPLYAPNEFFNFFIVKLVRCFVTRCLAASSSAENSFLALGILKSVLRSAKGVMHGTSNSILWHKIILSQGHFRSRNFNYQTYDICIIGNREALAISFDGILCQGLHAFQSTLSL